MNRIPLTDEDIFVVYGDDEILRSATGTCDVMFQKGMTDEDAEQLKKQILDDYEFSNEYSHPDWQQIRIVELKELKEKAEKWDEHQKPYKMRITYQMLEQENKQLKIDKDVADNLTKRDKQIIYELQKNKEIVQKVREQLDLRESGKEYDADPDILLDNVKEILGE